MSIDLRIDDLSSPEVQALVAEHLAGNARQLATRQRLRARARRPEEPGHHLLVRVAGRVAGAAAAL
ncbi:MAG: hypothetical protein U1F25_17715 [Rubrivivax sp.]